MVSLSDTLLQKFKGYRLADQILGSGTSIGANIREAGNAESAADFTHKLAIALKECDETIYWLDLLLETKRITTQQHEDYIAKSLELRKMLTASIVTEKKKSGRIVKR